MKDLIYFYIKPYHFVNGNNYSTFFKNSLALYFITIFIFSSLSFIFLNNELITSSPVSDSFTFFLIRTFGLALKQPTQVLFLTFVAYLLLGVFIKSKITFSVLYKIIFVAFNLVVISYFIDTVNIFVKYFYTFHIVNIFKYNLNDIFIKGNDCSQFLTSFFKRINPLLILSIIYLFYLTKNNERKSNFKLLYFIVLSILLTLFLFSSIPIFFLSLFKFAST